MFELKTRLSWRDEVKMVILQTIRTMVIRGKCDVEFRLSGEAFLFDRKKEPKLRLTDADARGQRNIADFEKVF